MAGVRRSCWSCIIRASFRGREAFSRVNTTLKQSGRSGSLGDTIAAKWPSHARTGVAMTRHTSTLSLLGFPQHMDRAQYRFGFDRTLPVRG